MRQAKKRKTSRAAITNRVVPLGIGLGALYWILDSVITTSYRHEGDLVKQILAPEADGLARRALALALLLAFAVCIRSVIKRQDQAKKALEEREARYRRLVEGSPDAIVIQREGEVVFMNTAGASLLGAKDADQLIGRSICDFVPPEFREIFEGRHPPREDPGAGTLPVELNLLRLDGTSLAAEVIATSLIYEGKPATQAILRDVTKRKRAEEEIRQRNIELAALNAIASTVSQSLELSKVLSGALDDVLRLKALEGQAYGMIFLRGETDRLSLATQRGAPRGHPCLTEPPAVGECLCGLAIQGGKAIIAEDCYADERHTRSWPDMPWHKDVCLPLKVRGKALGVMNVRLPPEAAITDNVVGLLTAVADQISVAVENARLFEAVRKQRERLRVLGARLAEAEEAERRRLARELHDQVGQNLTALGITLNILRTQTPGGESETMRAYLDESLALVEQTTERIRNVMAELRPPMLDDYGLMATLRWYGEQFTSRLGLPVRVLGTEPAPRLPVSMENALFRVATEALTNVAKHAHANQVTLELEVDAEIVRLAISDDGVGFDPAHVAGPEGSRGWGLLTMAERAEALGGRFRIESRPSCQGTRVAVEIDL